jgi:NADPH-dependent 2,4-dienoyl-CoA reductase/sulfur reductase-like enzyme
MEARRRRILGGLAAATVAAAIPAVGRAQAATRARVVVIGGGFSGATAAKYIRKWDPSIDVTLVEPKTEYVSCPMSNRVLGGGLSLRDITRRYDGLAAYGVRVVHDVATDVDPVRREVRVARGDKLPYDRLVVAPGVDLMFEALPGVDAAQASETLLHSWQAGAQTLALRRSLHAMRQGGVFAIHIPKAPYRCPPGPYERASMVAYYIKHHNPQAKVLVLDSNPDVQSKGALFRAAWAERYKGIIEYMPNAELKHVDLKAREITVDLHGKVKADVLNVIPPQRAGSIAYKAGAAKPGDRWCGVDFLTYESLQTRNVHVIGDSVAAAPGMPKSGHMANQQAKVCASAVVSLLKGQPVNDEPVIANTCYSFVGDREVVHVASVHRYDGAKKTMLPVQGAGGLSTQPSAQEGYMAVAWAFNILNDSFSV